jgi:hypothetical protein
MVAGTFNMEYLPIGGHRPFCEESVALAYGADALPVREKTMAMVQSLSGTGACRWAAAAGDDAGRAGVGALDGGARHCSAGRLPAAWSQAASGARQARQGVGATAWAPPAGRVLHPLNAVCMPCCTSQSPAGPPRLPFLPPFAPLQAVCRVPAALHGRADLHPDAHVEQPPQHLQGCGHQHPTLPLLRPQDTASTLLCSALLPISCCSRTAPSCCQLVGLSWRRPPCRSAADLAPSCVLLAPAAAQGPGL